MFSFLVAITLFHRSKKQKKRNNALTADLLMRTINTDLGSNSSLMLRHGDVQGKLYPTSKSPTRGLLAPAIEPM